MLREWATAVCFCAVVCSLAGMLLPESQMQKVFKILTSLIFLSCLISPIMSLRSQPLNFQLDLSMDSSEEITRQAEEVTQKLAFDSSQAKVEQVIRYNLERIGVEAEKISVTIHNEESDNILFIEAVLTLEETYQGRRQEIKDFIKRELDIDCTFLWNEVDLQNE